MCWAVSRCLFVCHSQSGACVRTNQEVKEPSERTGVKNLTSRVTQTDCENPLPQTPKTLPSFVKAHYQKFDDSAQFFLDILFEDFIRLPSSEFHQGVGLFGTCLLMRYRPGKVWFGWFGR